MQRNMQVTLSNTNAEKTSASKPEDPSSIPGIDMVERTGACKLSPELHVCSDIYTTYTYTPYTVEKLQSKETQGK